MPSPGPQVISIPGQIQGGVHICPALFGTHPHRTRPENISRTIQQDRTSRGAPPAMPGGVTSVPVFSPTPTTWKENVVAGTGQKGSPALRVETPLRAAPALPEEPVIPPGRGDATPAPRTTSTRARRRHRRWDPARRP